MFTFVNQNFVRGQPSKVLCVHRPGTTRSTTQHHKSNKFINSLVSPQDIRDYEKVLSKAAKNISTHNTTEMMKPETKNLDNNALSLCPQYLLPSTHDNKSLMPSAASEAAKRYLDEDLRLNELQIILLQERINHRNRAKLANTTNAARHELVYFPNYSWKITNINQQSVLQRCQFPCIVSKAALCRFS